ncbi:uncharacterized protein C22orf42 isoform X2 [Symphalangus syndactylus]|uniref:uncharacterized protein C22orf42 isoform X2 n=1 Tax=Symphalangus syndactylus TaxID=9590 RepID=UPI003006B34E
MVFFFLLLQRKPIVQYPVYLDAHSKAYLKMLESYFESLDRRNARRAQDHQASVHGSGEKKVTSDIEKSKAKDDHRSAEDVHGSAHGSGEKKVTSDIEKSKAKHDQRSAEDVHGSAHGSGEKKVTSDIVRCISFSGREMLFVFSGASRISSEYHF